MRSLLRLPGHWGPQQDDRRLQSGSRYSPMLRRPSRACPQKCQAPVRGAYAVRARKHIPTLRRARSGIIIEIRWCPVHKGVSGNERRPTRRPSLQRTSQTHTEWNGYGTPIGPKHDRCRSPDPSRTSSERSRRRRGLKPAAGLEAGSPPRNTNCRVSRGRTREWLAAKRLASRFYQLKTGHCLTGQYLKCTGNQPTTKCWWCPYRTQTREHVFKHCPR
jgi:hypothetical protein